MELGEDGSVYKSILVRELQAGGGGEGEGWCPVVSRTKREEGFGFH